MRSLRWSLGLTRWLLYVVVIVGVAADVRFALLPPSPRVLVRAVQSSDDAAGEWFAERFARAYLSWGLNPATRETSLTPFVGPTNDPNLGVRPNPGAKQVVQWTQLAGRGETAGNTFSYTVAVQTSGDGLVYLDVDVRRIALNRYVLANYPAIVAGPPTGRAGGLDGAGLPAVTDEALQTVLSRALGNYLAGSVQDLDADLTNGAVVQPPSLRLTLEQVLRFAVEPSGAVLGTAVVQDRSGTTYTLSYTIVAVLRSGRWEVSAIAPTAT
jgi:hypothetical protein